MKSIYVFLIWSLAIYIHIIFIYIANDQIETKSHLRLTLKIKKRWTIHSRFEERSLSDSESVFGKKKEYQLKFNHEDDFSF